MGNTGIEP